MDTRDFVVAELVLFIRCHEVREGDDKEVEFPRAVYGVGVNRAAIDGSSGGYWTGHGGGTGGLAAAEVGGGGDAAGEAWGVRRVLKSTSGSLTISLAAKPRVAVVAVFHGAVFARVPWRRGGDSGCEE